jgi:hypothetical protein
MPRPHGAVLQRLRVDEVEAAPLSPADELPSQGEARARARGLVWPSDTGHTKKKLQCVHGGARREVHRKNKNEGGWSNGDGLMKRKTLRRRQRREVPCGVDC